LKNCDGTTGRRIRQCSFSLAHANIALGIDAVEPDHLAESIAKAVPIRLRPCSVGAGTYPPGIQADWSGTVREHEQEAARDRDILEKHEHLNLIGEIAMKYQRGEQ
jgi:hypothetical protein